MRVLVTGGAGYIGGVLCERLLAAGHRVVALDNLLYAQNGPFHLAANPCFDFVRGDAREPELMRRLVAHADVLVPLAALVGAPACDRDPWLAREVNLEAIRLLNKLRSPQQLVIYPTTNSGYGTKSGELYCTEDTPLEPISLYGRLKVEAEMELLGSPNAITLRLATVFGPSSRMRLDLLVNHFVHLAVTQGYVVIFEKDFKRNYVHINDVADCFAFAIERCRDMAGRAFNLGLDSANLSKQELAELVQRFVPRFHVQYSEIGSDPDKRNYIVSSERLRQAGFQARRSLEDGIQELLKAYRMMGLGDFRNA
ncbi:MAG TPA: NAD(P)-dependent oxidoreductase [Candidatus Acidoferrales bacterium]|nr:NAD(P)-dependent oxidoreductase [Candidatus Acidoferrales bacterium]